MSSYLRKMVARKMDKRKKAIPINTEISNIVSLPEQDIGLSHLSPKQKRRTRKLQSSKSKSKSFTK
jgi:hypothetical protein